MGIKTVLICLRFKVQSINLLVFGISALSISEYELNSTDIRFLNRLPHFCRMFDGSCRI